MVDDDENVLRGHARVLVRAGYEVHATTTGEAALAMIEARDFDVVLLDVRMPQMDGIAFLRTLRERHDAVPVVLVTGSLTAESAALAINLGVARCLMKPVNARELTDGVTRAIGHPLPTHSLH
ncbi:MAG: response regulator [Archangium sp.]